MSHASKMRPSLNCFSIQKTLPRMFITMESQESIMHKPPGRSSVLFSSIFTSMSCRNSHRKVKWLSKWASLGFVTKSLLFSNSPFHWRKELDPRYIRRFLTSRCLLLFFLDLKRKIFTFKGQLRLLRISCFPQQGKFWRFIIYSHMIKTIHLQVTEDLSLPEIVIIINKQESK